MYKFIYNIYNVRALTNISVAMKFLIGNVFTKLEDCKIKFNPGRGWFIVIPLFHVIHLPKIDHKNGIRQCSTVQCGKLELNSLLCA